MLDFPALGAGLSLLFSSFSPWMVVIPGILIGLTFGAIPGLQISMAMAIFLPMTLYMDFMQAMLFLTSIFTGGGFGGSIPAILMNIPGTSSAISTAFDGYPMSRKGQHNTALGIALGASCFGVLIGYSALLLLIRPVSELVLKMGPAEMSAVILWGILLIASLSGKQLLKGAIAGLTGLMLGTIGYSEAGVPRGTLGSDFLLDGIPVIPAMMGMFAASELFRAVNSQYLVADAAARKVSVGQIFAGFRKALSYPWIILRGSLIGIFVGAVPGVGSSVANLLSYIETRRGDRDPESFGLGNPAGVVASESANSTSEAGSMATLLALGIPGGGATAVMLAAFTMHNITGGPQFIREQTDIVYAIILANLAQAFPADPARAALHTDSGQCHQGAHALPRSLGAGARCLRGLRTHRIIGGPGHGHGFRPARLGVQALRLFRARLCRRPPARRNGRRITDLFLSDKRRPMELPAGAPGRHGFHRAADPVPVRRQVDQPA